MSSSPYSRDSGEPCDFSDFTHLPGEHIVIGLQEPVVVHAFRGSVRSITGDWPDAAQVLFEVREVGETDGIRVIHIDMPLGLVEDDLPEGRYCFKISAFGWQAVEGMIIVSRDAPTDRLLSIVLPLGV